MSKAGRPRVHLHLSRKTIARTALGLVDRDGLEALSLRNLAAELGVGTMTLYGHVRTRDEIVSDVVGLLLAEVDTSEQPAEGWDDGLRRVAHSLRAMALRHPRAFALVAAAPVDEPPVLDYARSLARLQAAQGMPADQFVDSWKVIDAFLTGALLMETAAVVRRLSAARTTDDAEAPDDPFRRLMTGVQSAEAFAASLEVIIAGLRQTQAASD